MDASDGKLAGSVLELAQTLTRYNTDLAERSAEKERTSKILAEFRKHTAWQAQRKQLMRIRGGGAEVHHLFNQLHGKLFAAPLLAAARVLRNASSVSEQVDAVMMKAPDDSVPATPAAPGGAKTLYAL